MPPYVHQSVRRYPQFPQRNGRRVEYSAGAIGLSNGEGSAAPLRRAVSMALMRRARRMPRIPLLGQTPAGFIADGTEGAARLLTDKSGIE